MDTPLTVAGLVQEAMLRSLTQDVREKLLAEAVASILKPQGSGYGQRLSPLAEAFTDACVHVMREEAQRMVAADAHVREAITKTVTLAITKWLESDGIDTMATALANALGEKIRRADRD